MSQPPCPPHAGRGTGFSPRLSTCALRGLAGHAPDTLPGPVHEDLPPCFSPGGAPNRPMPGAHPPSPVNGSGHLLSGFLAQGFQFPVVPGTEGEEGAGGVTFASGVWVQRDGWDLDPSLDTESKGNARARRPLCTPRSAFSRERPGSLWCTTGLQLEPGCLRATPLSAVCETSSTEMPTLPLG